MSDIINAIIFGIVQGFTEFLPVSSSGHLELAKYIFDDDSVASESLMMSIVLHGATALSTIVVFRRDIWEIVSSLFSLSWNDEKMFALSVMLSMIPAAFVGLFFESFLEQFFDQRIAFVGLMLIVTGLLLFLADRASQTDKAVSYGSAILIGIAQAVAILPGLSRSGATISTAVLLGIDKEKAARFSFLMVIPLIFGKIAKDLLSGEFQDETLNLSALGVGFAAAFITGILACTWMIRLVKASKLSYFAIYCFLVGILAIGCSLWI